MTETLPVVKRKNQPPPPPLGNQRAKGNRGGTGRPPKFRPEMVERARLAFLADKTDHEAAVIVGVSESTLKAWKATRPEFSGPEWKQRAVKVIEASLFQRATGFVAPDVHVSSYEGNVTVTPIEKYYPPDVTAAKLFLEKQAPKEWGERDPQDTRLVNINIAFMQPMVSNPVSPHAIEVQSERRILPQPSDTPAEGRQAEGAQEEKK